MLIYDLGGGTFDVTVARITPEEIVILSTAGDHDLGGKNWDDRIATFLAERFAAETGFDPLDDPMALNEVLVRSEQAKWTLSERTSTRITLQLGTERRSFELARAEFEAMTFPLMDRTRRLTEEALGEAGLAWPRLDGVLLVGGSTRMPMVRTYVSQMAGKPPRTGVNVDEVVALGAAIQAAIEVGQTIGDAVPRFTLRRRPAAAAKDAAAASRRVTDVMSHSLGTIAVSPDGSAYVNDIVIRRNLPIPARNTKSYLHETHGGANARLEVYLTQGESTDSARLHDPGQVRLRRHPADRSEVTIDVGLSYDSNGVVQVQAVQRDTAPPAADDRRAGPRRSLVAGPPARDVRRGAAARADPRLPADRRVGEHDRPAAGRGPDRRARVPVEVRLHDHGGRPDLVLDAGRAPVAGDEQRARLHAAVHRLEAEGSTNLTDALEMARGQLVAGDRKRYIVILTDGYPDAPESALEQARARGSRGSRSWRSAPATPTATTSAGWPAASRRRSSRGAASWCRRSATSPA